MKFKLEKKLKIVNELITYFHKLGNSDIHIDLCTIDDKSYFCISGKVSPLSNNDISSLVEILETPRQHEVEEYYWQLGGESELECELTLISMMIDDAIITYQDDVLTIKLIRIEN